MNPTIVTVCRNSGVYEPMPSRQSPRMLSWIFSNPGETAVAAIDRHVPDLVIVDSAEETDAQVLDFIARIKSRYPVIPIFLVAWKSSESLAIGALKAGANDYLKGPFCCKDLLAAIDRALNLSCSDSQTNTGQNRIADTLVGDSQVMQDLKGLLSRISKVDSTVLITGETGTGKELAAGLIHENSHRADHAMVSVNCAALPDNLVESELFGYERGAFTGAVATSRGRFEQAQKGTVFLDEIGDMSPFAQAKILRVVEDKQMCHLGGCSAIRLDFRLIAATNRIPEKLMETGTFRDDLFYRLNVARVHMPSLREHREDIPDLVAHGIRRLNRKFNRNVKGLREDLLQLLLRYEWPGNVRELMNVLEGAYINMPKRKINHADLPEHFKERLTTCQHRPTKERKRILATLLETNWNKSTAAKKLNWSRMTLYRKMAQHKIVEKRNDR